MRRTLALCVVPLVVAACASAGQRPGWDRPWRELRSTHVTLYTDLSERDAITAVRGFEERHHRLGAALFAVDPPELHTRVIALRDDATFFEIASEGVGAFYSSRLAFDAQQTPTVVMHGLPTNAVHETWQHELAHRFLHHSMGSMPDWLAEGMAEYYSTVRADDEVLVLGGYLGRLAFVVGGGWRSMRADGTTRVLLPVAQATRPSELLRLDSRDFYLSHARREDVDLHRKRIAHYASSWALVHMLISEPDYRPRYERLMALVADGMEADDALCEVLGDVPLSTLDEDLVAYVQRDALETWPQPYEPPRTAEPEVVSLTRAHVLLLRAKLTAGGPETAKAAGVHVAEALSLAPEDPWVLQTAAAFARWSGDFERARARLEDARGRTPPAKDVLVELMALYAHDEAPWPAESREAWLREVADQLEPVASTAAELDALASYHVDRARAKEALPLSLGALRADPNCGRCFETHARISFELGDAVTAVLSQRVAIQRTSEHAPPDTLQAMQERLAGYAAAANLPAGGPASAPRDCWPG